MNIGLGGRIGAGIALSAAIADASTWIIRAIDNYPFDFYRWTDAFLPVIFVFGLCFGLPAISAAIQSRHTANLIRLPLTTAGPAEWRLDADPRRSLASAAHREPGAARDHALPALAFVPSASHRRLYTKLGRMCLLGAVLIFAATEFWRANRVSILLNMPVGLASGHNLTAEFRTPLRAVYSLDLSLASCNPQTCNLRCNSNPPVRWTLLSSGRPVATGAFRQSAWYGPSIFDEVLMPRGAYRLDIEPLAGCAIDPWGNPRIKVEANWQATGLDQKAELLLCLLLGFGIALLLWPDVRETEELSLQGEPRATFEGTIRLRRKRQPQISLKPLPSLRMFSYMAATGLMLIWWFWPIAAPLTPRGLLVHIPRPGTYARADEPWNKPLVVRVDPEREIFLDGRLISRERFEPEMQRSLALRADWTVYVDGDADATAGDVLELVDLLRGMGITNILLVTPSMKREQPKVFATPHL